MAPPLRPRVPVRAPVVRTSPVLARYLDDLAQQARMADAAADARRLDIHFGRVQPDDPFAGIGGDEIADMVGATGAPRRWLEAADYNQSIGSMMPGGLGEPMLDALARNDRTRALVQGRLDRLAPEQMPGSLGLVGRRYEADQSAARAADILSGRNRDTAMALGAAGALGAGAFGARMALENQQNQQDQVLLGAWKKERDLMDSVRQSVSEIDMAEDDPVIFSADIPTADEVNGFLAEGLAVPPHQFDAGGFDARSDERDSARDSALMASVGSGMDDIIDRAKGAPGMNAVNARIPSAERVRNSFLETPFISRTAEGDFRPSEDYPFRGKNTYFASDFRPPSPEESVAAAPGPESQVAQDPDLEDLPGPQLRSMRALMRSGIPEGRARDIILKGSSMSPDEYRMVTGGRR